MTAPAPDQFPMIRSVGTDGLLVSFGDRLSEPANRAALAFRGAVDRAGWDGVSETSTSLVSTYLRFDPLYRDRAALRAELQELLKGTDWLQEPLPEGRRHFRIPCVYGTDLAPQLDEAAEAAGLSRDEAIRTIAEADLRVTTIGFAPGQPYIGELPAPWDIPRQQSLTQSVPRGAVVVAIRQICLFSNPTPTGWRHIGQTAFRLFRPDSDTPFVLRPGDGVTFVPTDPEHLPNIERDPDGGAEVETLP